jgi:hypothetical protein
MAKFKRVFAGDINSSIIPQNLNKYTRLAQIIEVDGTSGKCSIRFLDMPSSRTDVIILQTSPGVFNIPEIGSICAVVFDINARPFIIGYINLGHESRVKQLSTLPKFKSGEKFFEAGGSYFYIKKNGNIIISTLSGNFLEIENTTGSLKFETVNWKVVTEGGLFYFGLVKRLIPNVDGTTSYKNVSNIIGDNYTELNLKVMETADGSLGVDETAEPLIDLTLGTLIDKDGNKITKNDTISPLSSKEVLLRLTLKNGTQIDVDKEGRCSIKGIKLNINEGSVDSNDPDVLLELETNDTNLGTKGQHVAREHDEVTIPITSTYTDPDHAGLIIKNEENFAMLNKLATAFISPIGPCFFNPGILINNEALKGEITEGAKNVYVGDK